MIPVLNITNLVYHPNIIKIFLNAIKENTGRQRLREYLCEIVLANLYYKGPRDTFLPNEKQVENLKTLALQFFADIPRLC